MTAKVYARWFMDIPPFQFELRRTGNGKWCAEELTHGFMVISVQSARVVMEPSRKSMAAHLRYAYGAKDFAAQKST